MHFFWRRLLIGGTALCLAGGALAQSNQCTGDCSADREVTVDEIVTMVNIALGTLPIGECPQGDTSGDGEVTVDELQAAINAALSGCTAFTPTPTMAPPTATPEPSGLRIDLSSAIVDRGGRAAITASLAGAVFNVAATSNDIRYDRGLVQIVRLENGKPDCAIDPRIGPGTLADKMLTTSVLPVVGNQETVRIGLFGINMVPLTAGPLFSCKFVTSGDIEPQTIVLKNNPGAATLEGYDVVNRSCTGPADPLSCCSGVNEGTCIVGGRDGEITVR